MKFERTASARADFKRLSPDSQRAFLERAKEFSRALDEISDDPARLHPGFRVKRVRKTTDVWEMTWERWNGRATFEWCDIGGERGVRWRRIGNHSIFHDP